MRRFLPDEALASAALFLMTLIPLVEMAVRPLFGKGIDNAPLLVQHLGLILAMFGALLAERGGHLTSLGNSLGSARDPRVRAAAGLFAHAAAALLCGLLGAASWAWCGATALPPSSAASSTRARLRGILWIGRG